MNESEFSYSQFVSLADHEASPGSQADSPVSTSQPLKLSEPLPPMPPEGLKIPKYQQKEPSREKKFVEMVMKQQKKLERDRLLEERRLNGYDSDSAKDRPPPKLDANGFIDYKVDFEKRLSERED